MATKLGYRAALDWLLANDDTEWLHEAGAPPSVTLCLVADIFGKDTDEAVSDLAKRDAQRKRNR